jgi:hypothetical protein
VTSLIKSVWVHCVSACRRESTCAGGDTGGDRQPPSGSRLNHIVDASCDCVNCDCVLAGEEARALEAALGVTVMRHKEKKPAGGKEEGGIAENDCKAGRQGMTAGHTNAHAHASPHMQAT